MPLRLKSNLKGIGVDRSISLIQKSACGISKDSKKSIGNGKDTKKNIFLGVPHQLIVA